MSNGRRGTETALVTLEGDSNMKISPTIVARGSDDLAPCEVPSEIRDITPGTPPQQDTKSQQMTAPPIPKTTGLKKGVIPIGTRKQSAAIGASLPAGNPEAIPIVALKREPNMVFNKQTHSSVPKPQVPGPETSGTQKKKETAKVAGHVTK